MDLTIFAGKGGVGKSTAAAAYALQCSEKGKTLLMDYDAGHSCCRVLGLTGNAQSNTITSTGLPNLSLCIVDPLRFKTIMQTKVEGAYTEDYLEQFIGDQGLVAWTDMMNEFFGVPTDPLSVSHFLQIPEIFYQAQESRYIHLVMDVEPTAGLERLLSHAKSTTRSLRNLNKAGMIMLSVIGTTWPDIGEFLAGEYIDQAETYATRLESTVAQLKEAHYILVATPEASPVQQMGQVEEIIQAYGGRVHGYIANNVRGEPHEDKYIQRLQSKGKFLTITHDGRLCDDDPAIRQQALRGVGGSLSVFE